MENVQHSEELFGSLSEENNAISELGLISDAETTAIKNGPSRPSSHDEIATSSDVLAIENAVSNEHKAEDALSDAAFHQDRVSQFPLTRVKQIMKLDAGVAIFSPEAVFLVTKAAEFFVQTLAKESSSYTMDSKKKTVTKADVERAIDNVESLLFLDEMLKC
ncbi:DNA polymerase epsilon subunit 4 [Anopheles bellator]|uniref:DNA polymerase epsilon subunit 4 n=1 Tax=Anopheles bellator TaxID=139047 RepID=UPI00264828CE|nr:DNA polymerase epsilon subunit 4 [Anopheles bellator]